MSRSATPERDGQLLDIGKQCSDPTCLLIDFLPFKCQHCAQPFCGEHFLPTAHHCPKYDAAKHDRVAPSCEFPICVLSGHRSRLRVGPLCSAPVAIPPGQDPNIRMERHINTECSVMTGRSSKAKSTPHCARSKCGKVLFSPIRCGVSDFSLGVTYHLDPYSGMDFGSLSTSAVMQAAVLSRTSLSQGPFVLHHGRVCLKSAKRRESVAAPDERGVSRCYGRYQACCCILHSPLSDRSPNADASETAASTLRQQDDHLFVISIQPILHN